MDILKLFKQLLSWALALLPDSPFQALDISPITPCLSAVNWTVPVSFIVATVETWLVAIVTHYTTSAVPRWARTIS